MTSIPYPPQERRTSRAGDIFSGYADFQYDISLWETVLAGKYGPAAYLREEKVRGAKAVRHRWAVRAEDLGGNLTLAAACEQPAVFIAHAAAAQPHEGKIRAVAVLEPCSYKCPPL